MTIQSVPLDSREHLLPCLEECFAGMYRWHAGRTLRTVRWVREAMLAGAPAGLAMLTMLGRTTGYVYYVAVTASQRKAGVGGHLLDDAIRLLQSAGVREILACVQVNNIPSVRLFQSRGFARTRFRERMQSEGLIGAAALWMRMVVAPGEMVLARAPEKSSA
jgi:ribosomal protein S18 acetylase RimI-like enzyme